MLLLREPLIHFLLIGAAIFGLHAVTDDPVESEFESEARIVITAGEIDRLRGLWHKQWRRTPTAEELRGLIDDQIREEVLYREALALGLDRDDTVVRRRLVQKFEFLVEDLAASRDPDPAALLAHFEANRERYRILPRLSFTQIYFSLDRRGAAARRDAELVLASLHAASTGATTAGLGDGLMLGHAYEQETTQDIEATFGRGFADAVLGLDPGIWTGPIASGYGLHLVRVDEHVAARLPSLSEVEAQVRNDWAHDQRLEANRVVYQQLLARYDVAIEGDASAAVSQGETGTDGVADR
jgi:hypothetical protein